MEAVFATQTTAETWSIKTYVQNILFSDDRRTALAPLARRFKMYASEDTEYTPYSWKMGLQLMENGFLVECSEAVYWHFLECVPPVGMKGAAFLFGEASTSIQDGQSVYIAGTIYKNRHFMQMCTQKQFEAGHIFKNTLLA